MDNKYYTPDISEFSLGFEFEVLNTKENFFLPDIDEGLWNKSSVSFGVLGDLFNIHKLILDKQIRVKYLDKSDLKELGFVHIGGKMMRDTRQLYTLNNGRYFVHLETTSFSSWVVIRIDTSVDENSVQTNVVHSITINNKHELKRLMKQLNIV